jgi:hypothetical protein
MKKLLILTALTMFVGSTIGCGILDRWCAKRGAQYPQCPPATYGAPVYSDCAPCGPAGTVMPGPEEAYGPTSGG